MKKDVFIKHADEIIEDVKERERTKPQEPHRCDFCSEITDELEMFPQTDFVHRTIFRTDTGVCEMITCLCHVPPGTVAPLRPDDRFIDYLNEGGYGACRECAKYVRRKDPLGLARSTVQRWTKDEPRPTVEMMLSIHEQYWVHRVDAV